MGSKKNDVYRAFSDKQNSCTIPTKFWATGPAKPQLQLEVTDRAKPSLI